MHTSLIFERIETPQDELYNYFRKIYEEAFPRNERRTPENLALEMRKPNANVCIIRAVLDQPALGIMKYYTNGNDMSLVSKTMDEIEHSMPVGILVFWEFDEFIYLGHFAIASDLRNHKLGGQFLKDFIKNSLKPIVLEVEHPDTDIAVRRIHFYERLGLKLCTKGYIQPSYSADLETLPLLLMETQDSNLLEHHFDKVVGLIHDEVYWESH